MADDLIHREEWQFVATGADKVAADTTKVDAAQRKLTEGTKTLTTTTDVLSRTQIGVTNQLDRFTKAHDPLSRAQSALEKGLRLTATATAQGIPLTDAHTRALANLKARTEELAKASEGTVRGIGSTADMANRARMEMLELTHISKSLFDELAAGQSPLRALTLEGGRIAEMFSMGGVGGVFARIASTIGGFALSGAGALTGIGLAAAGATIAAMKFEAAQDRLSASLEGRGRLSGMTLGDLNALSAQGAASGHLSIANAQGAAGAYAHAGLGSDVTSGLLNDTRAYSRIAGVDVSKGADQLASIFTDPAKGLGALEKDFGPLSDKIQSTVRNLEAQGQMDAARRVLLQSLNAAIADTTDRSWSLSKAFDGAKDGFSNWLNRFGGDVARLVNGPTPEEKAASASADIDRLQKKLAVETHGITRSIPFFGDRANAVIGADQARLVQDFDVLASAQKEISASRAKADAQQKAARAAQISQSANIVESALPDFARSLQLRNNIGALNSLLANPQAIGDLGNGLGTNDVLRARSNMSVMLQESDPFVKMQQDAEIAMASINATSLAQTTAVKARKDELSVLRDTGDVIRASVVAENDRNEAIAKANHDAETHLETSKQNLGLVGLSPYQRGLQEIKNRYEGADGLITKATASQSDWNDAWKPIRADLASGAGDVRNFSTAIRDATAAMRGGAGAGTGASSPSSPYGSLSFSGSAPTSLTPIFAQASARTGIPAGIIEAVARQESNFSNPANGQGVMQITSGTASKPGYGLAPLSLGLRNDPSANINFGASYLAAVGGNVDWSDPAQRDRAFARYNGGGDPNYAAHVERYIAPGVASVPAQTLTAPATYRQAEQADTTAYSQQQILGPLTAANNSLKDRQSLLDKENSLLGANKSTLAGAIAAQQLLNKYENDGIPITKGLAKSIADYETRATATAKSEEQRQKTISGMDALRSDTNDVLGSSVKGLVHGGIPGGVKAFRSSMENVGNQLIDSGVGDLTSIFLGKKGEAGGGLLGNLFSGLFSGGFHIPGFADGGIMTSRGPLALRRYADGGVASSPQLAMYGEGSGPEAFIPLKNGSVPVAINQARNAQRGGGMTNVINHKGSDIVVQGSVDDRTLTQMRSMVESANADTVAQIQRNMTTLNSRNQAYFAQ